MGKSVGGRTTKIHVVVDGLGLPIEIRITEGQVGDVKHGDLALKGERPRYVICDKGYDSTEFRTCIRTIGSEPVIPCRKHRREQIDYDTHVYKERHLVENFFCKMKEFRRLSTRYDAMTDVFRAFVVLAAVLIWL